MQLDGTRSVFASIYIFMNPSAAINEVEKTSAHRAFISGWSVSLPLSGCHRAAAQTNKTLYAFNYGQRRAASLIIPGPLYEIS
jgi:hypothetical protein